MTMTPEERARLTVELAEYALDVMQEWMRIIEIDLLPGQPRVTWHDHQGAFTLGERPLGEEYGAFRLKVSVEPLSLPPIGPENDPAQIEEMHAFRGHDGSPCLEGFAEGNVCDRSESDAVHDDDHPRGVGDPNEKGSRDHLWGEHEGDSEIRRAVDLAVARVAESAEERYAIACENGRREANLPEWITRTMTDVRPGDSIRPAGMDMPGMRVTARCWPPTDDVRGRGSWHVIEGASYWDDHVIQPGECCVHLDGAGHRLFKPTFPVEILLAPSEVAAIEMLGWDNRERLLTSE